MTNFELTALGFDQEDRCMAYVYRTLGAGVDGLDVTAAALRIRCLAAMARVLRPMLAAQAEVMAQEACLRSQELGQTHPFEALPAFFQDEEDLQAAFHRGQRSLWGTNLPQVAPDDTGPLLVKEIRIRGCVARNEYDEHPGLATYWTDEDRDAVEVARDRAFDAMVRADDSGSERLERLAATLEAALDKGLALPEAMQSAQKLLAEVQAVENAKDHIGDGTFTSDGLMLLDQHAQVLQKWTDRGWLQPVARELWPRLLQQACDKDDLASTEACWDNFETAKRLRAEARDIRELVALSHRLPRAVLELRTKTAE
ncbi:hypothetical protein [Azohydromonas aeria]|uniref:hypothetical protein n=1 Tax=Azohydromonas aeria TaxID=2590212 RepID=UPI0012F9D390|nr:hypothetical protein [Azohydromonas aeria]